jgi:hypothetical protein
VPRIAEEGEMMTIYERLDKILLEISKKQFRENRGTGNEINFHIFDYDPKDEHIVRAHVDFLVKEMPAIKVFDLYKIMLNILKDKGYLEKVFMMEEAKGSEAIVNPIKKTLRLTMSNDLVVETIKSNVTDGNIVFLIGVGKAFPFIRSHTILNNLHSAINAPLVMFFPGTYDGLSLKLFDEIKDDNYYRAFRLIER